jgi:hypothetical protein
VKFLSLRCPGDEPPCELGGLVKLTAAVIDLLDLVEGTVDGFSDCDNLPGSAEAALAELREAALVEHQRSLEASRWYRWLRRDGPTNMGVSFDLSTPGRRVIEQFGPYSINTEVTDAEGRLVLDLHDSGSTVWIETFMPEHDRAIARLLQDSAVTFTLRP